MPIFLFFSIFRQIRSFLFHTIVLKTVLPKYNNITSWQFGIKILKVCKNENWNPQQIDWICFFLYDLLEVILCLTKCLIIKLGVANFFWGQSIGIDETKTFQLTFFSSMKIVGATGLGGLWALKWAWHLRVTNLHC